MTWKDAQKNECVMEITDLTAEGDEVMVLQPSDVPFVTTGNGDSDPMAPMRGQTGQIGFISDGGIVLMPGNSHQMRVVLRRGGFTAWTGWVKSETYNQGLWSGSTAVTVNVIDDVEALKTWKLDAAGGFGMVTLRELMTECLDHVNGITGGDALEMEWSVDIYPGISFEGLFDLQVSRYNFFSRVAESEAHEGMNCHDVMQEVCKTFGWTLSQVPGTPNAADTKMLFSYAGAVNYMRVPYASFRRGEWTGAEGKSPKEIDIEGMEPCGMHQYSLEPGYRKIGVVSKLKLVENSLPSLDFSDAEIKWVEGFTEEHRIKYLREGVEKQLPWRVRLLSPKNELVRFPRYTLTGLDDEDIEEVDVEITASNFDNYLGLALVSHDYWYGPEEDRGSTPQEGEKKLNYSWRTSMLLYTFGTRDTVPFLIARSSGSSIFGNGGFEIGFDLHLQTFDDSLNMYDKIKPYRASRTGPIKYGKALGENDTSRVVFSLRVGDMFWNGETWGLEQSTFEVTVEPQQAHSFASVRTNKTLDMPFSSTQHAIPISAHLSGEIELRMFGVYYVREDGTIRQPDRVIIENLTFGYCTPETDKPSSSAPADSHEYTHTEEGWTEDLESRVLSIYSDRGDAANYGVLTYAEGGTVKTLYDNLGKVSRRPEEALLEKMKAHYSRARKMLSVQYKAHDDATPRNVVRIGGVRYNVIMAQRMDWQRCHCEYLLEEA